jgi:flagellar biosynthesis/type III secretory pathway protein FliH
MQDKHVGGSLVPKGVSVEEFSIPSLKGKALPTYQEIKSTFHAQAMPKTNRFSLSELVSGQLSVEEDEKRRFEKKVSEELEARMSILKAEAYKQAYDKGLIDGKEKAFSEEKAKIAEKMEAIAAALVSLSVAKEKLSQDYEKALIEIIFRVAKILVHAELLTRPEAIVGTIRAILEKISKDDDVRIRISSREFEAIDEIRSQVSGSTRSGNVLFEMDATLGDSQCIVESLGGEISASIEEQYERLKIEVMKSLESSRTPDSKVVNE